MMFFYVVAFFLMAGGILLVLKLSPLDLLKMTVMTERKVKLKRSIRRSIKPVRKRGIQKIIGDTRETLRINDQSSKFPRLMLISLLMSVVGILIASAMDNPFLVPVLAVSFFLLPFLFVLLTSVKSQKRMNTALETALSTITSSYLRTESIVTAVEENVEQLDPYVRPSPDISALLENMKNSISNSVFHEWVDAMILCQNDRTLKSTLMPIVNKLSDIRVVSGELNTLLYEPLKDFAIMALLLLLEVPFLRSQNEEWYNILMFTPVGKLLISVDVVLLMVALIAVIRNLKPIEYRR